MSNVTFLSCGVQQQHTGCTFLFGSPSLVLSLRLDSFLVSPVFRWFAFFVFLYFRCSTLSSFTLSWRLVSYIFRTLKNNKNTTNAYYIVAEWHCFRFADRCCSRCCCCCGHWLIVYDICWRVMTAMAASPSHEWIVSVFAVRSDERVVLQSNIDTPDEYKSIS